MDLNKIIDEIHKGGNPWIIVGSVGFLLLAAIINKLDPFGLFTYLQDRDSKRIKFLETVVKNDLLSDQIKNAALVEYEKLILYKATGIRTNRIPVDELVKLFVENGGKLEHYEVRQSLDNFNFLNGKLNFRIPILSRISAVSGVLIVILVFFLSFLTLFDVRERMNPNLTRVIVMYLFSIYVFLLSVYLINPLLSLIKAQEVEKKLR
jgi:hypothetical protein